MRLCVDCNRLSGSCIASFAGGASESCTVVGKFSTGL